MVWLSATDLLYVNARFRQPSQNTIYTPGHGLTNLVSATKATELFVIKGEALSSSPV